MNRPLRGLLAALCLLPVVLSAAEPTAGTLTPDSGPLTYTSGPFLVSDPSGECAIGVCDYYDLTVSIPAGALAGFPSASVKIVIEWGGPTEDFDLYVYDAAGGEVANSGSALTASESLSFLALEGDTVYQVEISPYAVTGGTVNATITFEPGEPGVVPGPGGPVEPGGVPLGASGPGIPRYLTYTPPPALNGNVGEPSIGFNTETKRAFLLSGFKTLWATFPAEQDPPAPEACEAEWEDRSFVTTTVNTLDPIGITDSLVRGAETNRTWIGQLQAKSHLMAFTDDDGETWTPSEGNSVVLNGFDHQTIGSGPYPEGMEILARTSFPNALYYCGQDVAYANCARSDDGGLTFGPTTIMYDLTTCAGLHGHARVAPDGTVYVPAPDCNGEAGVAISEDAGTTWRVSTVPGSEASGFDPQLAVASDGTGYMCFAKGLGQAFVSVTTDKGETWSDPVNISQELGIQHIAFPQAVAGDGDRAACAFLGTTTAGNPNTLGFEGVWHVYFATTYDRGETWDIVNATPNDPVQGYGGIWDGGGGNYNRNLLDFNEITIDDRGYPLYGYSDGCIGSCDIDPINNSFAAYPKLVRQVGGRSLYAEFDTVEPAPPRRACLDGRRTFDRATLSWREPDNGGDAITGYKVFRGIGDGELTQIGRTNGKPAFVDLTADPAVETYRYSVVAVNSQGESLDSNIISLPVEPDTAEEDLCVAPGVTFVPDGPGDGGALPGTDLISVSVSEPLELDGNLLITLRVDDLSVPPANTLWGVRFNPPSIPASNPDNVFVAMVTDEAAPRFIYGSTTREVVVLASYTLWNEEGTLAPESTFAADGTIALVVPREVFGLQAGDKLVNPTAIVFSGATAAEKLSRSTNTEDAGVGLENYTLRSDTFCLPNRPPFSLLSVSDTTPSVGSTVTFDASGSTDDDGEPIVSYLFDFGDGTQLETDQPVVEHVYNDAGLYRAQLETVDERGRKSDNIAQAQIDVSGEASQAGRGATGVGAGGSLGRLSLLALVMALVLVRRPRRR